MSTRIGLVHLIDPDKVMTPVDDQVGLFVPDQTLSIRDIIQRFAITGEVSELAARVNEGYNGTDEFLNDDFIDLSSMDIAELQELNERSGQILQDYLAARNDVIKPSPVETIDTDKADA